MSRFVSSGKPALSKVQRAALKYMPASPEARRARKAFQTRAQREQEYNAVRTQTQDSEVTSEQLVREAYGLRGVRDVVQQKRTEEREQRNAKWRPWGEYTTDNAEKPQFAFDELFVRTILKYCPVHEDSLRSTHVWTLLKKEEPDFTPMKYGTANFGMLLKHCEYLHVAGGYVHFERLQDPKTGKVTGLRVQDFRFVGERSSFHSRPPSKTERELRWS